MPLNALHANHIGAVGGGFELQRPNNGLLFIVGLDGNANNVLSLSLASFSLPKENSNIVEVPFLNDKRKFAGMTTFDDLQVVINDYVDRPTAEILYRWRYLVKDPITGKMGNKASYAKTGRAVKYSPQGDLDREYTLEGIWPSAMDGGEIDMSNDSDGLKITMTLTIDKAYYTPAVSTTSTPAVL